MENVKIGPVTFFDIDQIRDVLRKHGVPFEEFTTEEKMEELSQANKEKSPTSYTARYDGPAQMIFLEVPDNALDLLRPTMIRLGYWHENESDGTELEGDDYLCPKCDHFSTHAGLCPTHHVSLITHEDWNKNRAQKASDSQRIVVVLLALILGAMWIASLL